MPTVFKSQTDFEPNWILLFFSLAYLIIGIRLFKQRIEIYKKPIQLVSSILLMVIGVIGLVIFIILWGLKQSTPQLMTAGVFLLFLPVICFFNTKEPQRLSDFFKPDAGMIFGLIFCMFTTYGAFALSYTLAENAKMERFISSTYQEGDAQTVQGRIENFHPMPDTLHDLESFSVGGVSFSYNNHHETYYYSICAFDGGYIKKNGQEVKLWYVTYKGCNYIVRIDLL